MNSSMYFLLYFHTFWSVFLFFLIFPLPSNNFPPTYILIFIPILICTYTWPWTYRYGDSLNVTWLPQCRLYIYIYIYIHHWYAFIRRDNLFVHFHGNKNLFWTSVWSYNYNSLGIIYPIELLIVLNILWIYDIYVYIQIIFAKNYTCLPAREWCI